MVMSPEERAVYRADYPEQRLPRPELRLTNAVRHACIRGSHMRRCPCCKAPLAPQDTLTDAVDRHGRSRWLCGVCASMVDQKFKQNGGK